MLVDVKTHDGKYRVFPESARCLLADESAQPSIYPPEVSPFFFYRPLGIKNVSLYYDPDRGDPTLSLAKAVARNKRYVYLDCGRSIARGQPVWTKCAISISISPKKGGDEQ